MSKIKDLQKIIETQAQTIEALQQLVKQLQKPAEVPSIGPATGPTITQPFTYTTPSIPGQTGWIYNPGPSSGTLTIDPTGTMSGQAIGGTGITGTYATTHQ